MYRKIVDTTTGVVIVYVYVVLLVSVGICKSLNIVLETVVANTVAWIKGVVCKEYLLLPLPRSYLRYYCVCLSLQIIPPRLLYVVFITELELINAYNCFPVFSSNQQLKYSTQKQKVVELINSDSRDAGLPFHVLCKEESRLVIALDHLTVVAKRWIAGFG